MNSQDIDFVIIGAAKCATTWLQRQLQSDPDVYMPDPELHFFAREFDRGLDWYLSQFTPPNPGLLIGEKSNSYLDVPEAAARLHAHLPQVRLIAQLRNPVDRAYSDYCMLYRRGDVSGDIGQYLDPDKASDSRFLIGGDYAAQLARYVRLFGWERLLVLDFEGVARDPETQIARTRAHLGLATDHVQIAETGKVKDKSDVRVPPHWRKRLGRLKPAVAPFRGTRGFAALRGLVAKPSSYPALPSELRAKLQSHYAPSVRALEDLTGQSFAGWIDHR
ncbi:sulfotransferase [Cognatishimia sp. MH4019]|uniref:sulfotransferase family protein n=1 Tax=Cognatishimia sp. MH4019 TaxID=2854030 RepID=UPI001CD73EC1|nr:sulfotransferase [Cognatishimia sp. MH4019]